MSQPLSEYFTQEAGEFLDQLEALLSASGAPDGERFFRVARGVRGSAQIAGVAGVAQVAERLEDAARALRDHALHWSDELRAKARHTLDDLRALVAAGEQWGPEQDERVAAAVGRWGNGGHQRRPGGDPADPADLVAFVRREVGGIGEEIGAVLGELRADPAAREPLRRLLRRMRPVRGVSGHPSLAPVLEVMEGVEDAAGDLLGRTGPAGEIPLGVLGAAREALRAAVELLGAGAGLEAMPELETFRAARDRLDGEEPGDPGVIPVSRLFDQEAGSHIVSSPAAPVKDLAGDGMRDDVETFLRIEATGFLDRAEGLIASSEHDPRRRLGRIARQLAELATSVRELAATYGLETIAGAADEAATRLRRAGSHAEAREALRGLRAVIPGAEEPAPASAAPAAEPASAPAPVPVASAAPAEAPPREPALPMTPTDDGVVPVESLLYAPTDALQEAIRMRGRIEGMVGPAGRVGAPLGDLLDELFGLLALARGTPSTG